MFTVDDIRKLVLSDRDSIASPKGSKYALYKTTNEETNTWKFTLEEQVEYGHHQRRTKILESILVVRFPVTDDKEYIEKVVVDSLYTLLRNCLLIERKE
jgi:hypothetical protein